MKKLGILCALFFTLMAAAQGAELKEGLYAKIHTNKGEILVKLYFERVPKTVRNFVALAEGVKPWTHPKTGRAMADTPLYRNLTFHRVIANFMVQTGDPMGDGRGGPGYQFRDEFHKDLKHDRPGRLSMANAGANTNGSQFFITHGPTAWLDGKHSIFGQVLIGQPVVNRIQQGDRLQKIEIIRVGIKAKNFQIF